MNRTVFNSYKSTLIIVYKFGHCNDKANDNSANKILSAFNVN